MAPLSQHECQYFSEKEDHVRLQIFFLNSPDPKSRNNKNIVCKTAAQMFSAAQQNPLPHIIVS